MRALALLALRALATMGSRQKHLSRARLSPCVTAFPALADSLSTTDKPVVLAGGQFCVGPGCVGRDQDRDWRSRRHGYGYDRDYGCRDVTISRDDSSVTHIRRCD